MSCTRLDLIAIIVSWNVQSLLCNCLESLSADLHRSGLQGEICVVDNASADGSPGMVRAGFSAVHLLALSENLGFAAANNIALRRLFSCLRTEAGGQGGDEWPGPRYVLLLNPDTTVEPGALKTLVAFMDAHPEAGVAGAQLRYPDGAFQHAAFHFPTLAQIFLDFFPLHHRLANSSLNGRYPRAWYERGDPFEIDHPLGAAMIARGHAINEVGGLDEGFFMYCEEIDWCWRMKHAGWSVHCVPGAMVVHHEAQSTRQFRDEMFVQLWHSRFLLFHKHYGSLFRWLAGKLVGLGVGRELARAQDARAAGQLSPERYARRLDALQRVQRMR